MTETHLQLITNSGTWMLILVPTYSTKIFIGQTVMTTYVIPFVIGMLLARDSIVGIIIPSSISLPASRFTRSVMHHPVTMRLCNSCLPEEHFGCYQTSQRNWVIIKVLYRCLRRYLLGWRISRLGFVTPIVGEVSLGPLSNAHHKKPCK